MVQTVSSYKSGKPIFVVSIIILAGVVLLPFALIANYFISEEIDRNEVHKHVNVEYFEQLILRSEKIVVVYKDVEYVNPDNSFREYYSESHKTPVDETPVQGIEADYFLTYVCDGNYTCEAVYANTSKSFSLFCGAADYETYRRAENYVGFGSPIFAEASGSFPYNSLANWNNLISYFK